VVRRANGGSVWAHGAKKSLQNDGFKLRPAGRVLPRVFALVDLVKRPWRDEGLAPRRGERSGTRSGPVAGRWRRSAGASAERRVEPVDLDARVAYCEMVRPTAGIAPSGEHEGRPGVVGVGRVSGGAGRCLRGGGSGRGERGAHAVSSATAALPRVVISSRPGSPRPARCAGGRARSCGPRRAGTAGRVPNRPPRGL